MLFSFLIASTGAASTAGIGLAGPGQPNPSPIKNNCGLNGVVPNSYTVTLKGPTNKNRRNLGFLNRWFKQYDEGSGNGKGNGKPTRAVHRFIHTQFAVAIEASDNVAMRMAKDDPAVFSVDYNCYCQFNSSSIPESGDSSPGRDSPDLDGEVARRLSVQLGAPWGIDRIDTNGGAINGIYDDGDFTGSGVRVYVVDTGVQGSHQDFGGRVESGHTSRVVDECASCQAVNGILPADGTGCFGHGTHVASTVGGLKYGVAKNVTIVPAFSCFGFTCSNGSLKQF